MKKGIAFARRKFAKLAGLGVLGLLATASVLGAAPNIVIFFVDDLGWNDLGFRNPTFETPHIDTLAGESLSFEQATIASPTCSPSRSTLHTGKHPARLHLVRHIPTGPKYGFNELGVPTERTHQWPGDPANFPSVNWLELEHTTYAEMLKKHGYHTLFAGKWHLGHEPYHPIHQGFDRQIGASNFGHPKSYYPPYFKAGDVMADETERYMTDRLTDEVVEFIQTYDRPKPFMVTFSYYNVHAPPVGRTDFVEHYLEKGLDKKQANYAAQVSAVDASVGRVREALAAKGVAGETLIVFLSDQGSLYSNAPLKGGKRDGTALYEGGARVPFFVHWPGVTVPGATDHTPVQSTDLFPTLVELVGDAPSEYEDLDGMSLLSLIKDGSPLERDAIFGYRAYEGRYVSVRSGDYKFIGHRDGTVELYHVIDDIGEENDLSADQPERVDEMIKKLVAWEKEVGVAEYSGFISRN